MFNKTSSAIIKQFEAYDLVNSENREVYFFGIQQGLILLLNLTSMILIGILMHQWLQCVLYMALFIPLRSFAGGYHACSSQRCYVYSVACVAISMFITKFNLLNFTYCYCITVISGLIIFFLAPVEDHNKPFDKVEIIHYRVRTRVVLIIEGLFWIVSCNLKWKTGVICTTLALLSLSLMLILGIVKNTRNKPKPK